MARASAEGLLRLDRRRQWLRGAFAALAVVLQFRPPQAFAACNVIPQAATTFRAATGAVDCPLAGPDDWVELSAGSCGTSAGFDGPAAEHIVTLAFVPPAEGAKNLVILSPTGCSGSPMSSLVAACRQQVGGAATVTCKAIHATGSVIDIEKPGERTSNLRFRFPDTDNLASSRPSDDHTLTGPVRIPVGPLAWVAPAPSSRAGPRAPRPCTARGMDSGQIPERRAAGAGSGQGAKELYWRRTV